MQSKIAVLDRFSLSIERPVDNETQSRFGDKDHTERWSKGLAELIVPVMQVPGERPHSGLQHNHSVYHNLQPQITLTKEHLPGRLNHLADLQSWVKWK